MSESTTEWIRRLMGTSEPPPATDDAEASTEAEVKPPPTMSELIRARSRRHVDLFGQPPAAAASTPAESTETPAPTMNELIRQARRRVALFDEPAAVDPKE